MTMANIQIHNNSGINTSYQDMLAIKSKEVKKTYSTILENEVRTFGEQKGEISANSIYIAKIKSLYEVFFGKINPNEDVFAECVKFLKSNYPNFDFFEMELAFSLFAAGRLESEKDVNPYYGEPSVLAFAEIIRAYSRYSALEYKKHCESLQEKSEKTQAEIDRLNADALISAKETLLECLAKIKDGEASDMYDAFILGIPMLIDAGLIVIEQKKKVELSNIAAKNVMKKLDFARVS